MVDAPRLTRLTPLLEGATSVDAQADLGQILGALVAEARAATGARYGALGVIGPHSLLSEFIYDGITSEQSELIGHPPTGKGVLGTIIHERESLILESITDHPDSVGFPEHHPDMETFLGVPVAAGGESFGNLYLTEKDGGFTEDDLLVVEALSHVAGVAIQNFRLHDRLRRIAIVEDRQRIARDLHDSVIQDLFAVGLGLQALSVDADESVVAGLNSAIDVLDASVAALRRYIFELREAPRPTKGLAERIGDVVGRMASAYPTRVEMTVDEVHDGEWVDDALLLATEALSNALRHSKASLVELKLQVEDDHQIIEVVDDGIGFEVEDVPSGMGLRSMKARATAMGGWAEIESAPGSGTRVTARLPISPRRPPS